jgi:hypothetical protein
MSGPTIEFLVINIAKIEAIIYELLRSFQHTYPLCVYALNNSDQNPSNIA